MTWKTLTTGVAVVLALILCNQPVRAAATFNKSQNLLQVSCVKVLSGTGTSLGAYAVTLQLMTQAGGQLLLRLNYPVSRLAAIPADCAGTMTLNPAGTKGDLVIPSVSVDVLPGVTYSVQAAAALPPAPHYDFVISSLLQNAVVTGRAAAYQLTVALSSDGNVRCDFSNAEGCTLYQLNIAKKDDGSFQPELASVRNLFPGLPLVQPALSPDGSKVAFMGAKSKFVTEVNRNVASGQLYVLELATAKLSGISAGNTHNDKGQWPAWTSNAALIFSNTENCTETAAVEVACGDGRTFSDMYTADLSDPSKAVVKLAYGESDGSAGNWEACAFEDPWYMDGLAVFHGTTFNDVKTAECPFSAHVPLADRGLQYGPQPGVLRLSDGAPFSFDLKSAGINACAHFAGVSGLLICTEQNTIGAPYQECSIPGLARNACTSAGGHMILFNRLFGWSQQNGIYTSVTGKSPLFKHLNPAELPGAARYWNAKTDVCEVYKTKQAQIQGNTVLAHLYCQAAGDDGRSDSHATKFSRTVLIDITDREKPQYFDLTSWFEDNFPQWGEGEATGFTGVLTAR